MSSAKVLELEVSLEGIEPRIWRRFLVSAEATLAELHHTLQVVLGWTNSHLHAFLLPGGRQASDPDFQLSEAGERWLDEGRLSVGSVLTRRGSKLTYEYDFGDGWEHTVRRTRARADEDLTHPLPWCLDGARACPPEDVGGCGGYEELVHAIAHGPQSEWQEDLLEWAEDYRPEQFSVKEVNADLEVLREELAAPARSAPRVPKAMRARYEQVVAVTDAFCEEHLDDEYADLCAEMAAALARKRPSPLQRGRIEVWAAGIVYALGRLNFLSDPSFEPHMKLAEIGPLLGVGQSTALSKGNAIEKALKIRPHDPDWMRADLVESNPLSWLVETPTGVIVDARRLPPMLQRVLAAAGIDPSALA